MKIIKLTAENVKKLHAVEITPKGEIVTISGRNGQGKTSVLDSIWWALGGTAAVQAQPIRKGEKKAKIRLELGDFTVERRFTEAGSTLVVENADGTRLQSPQKMLDALLGELSFDPLAFARMQPREQFDELRKIAKLDIDIDQLDLENKSDYQKRTDINRDAKVKRAQAEAMPIATSLPDDPVDENEILDRIQSAGEKNALIEQHRARREESARQVDLVEEGAQRARAEAERLRKKADELDQEAKMLDAKAAGLRQALAEQRPLPEPVDITELRSELDGARLTNRLIAARTGRREIEKAAEALEKQSQGLTDAMDARTKVKTDAIARAQMPVEGLGFGEGFITYQSVPFDQASSAEQLRVSLAIAMAANPKLKIIRIQDGSLLDKDSLAAIAQMAKAGDYQVWIEVVDSSGKLGVFIEDGHVVAVDGEKVSQTA